MTVNVDDTTVGSTPDASANFALNITQFVPAGTLIISEVAPWSSGNSPVGADWFEVTNTGAITVNLTGWRMDDSSPSFANRSRSLPRTNCSGHCARLVGP